MNTPKIFTAPSPVEVARRRMERISQENAVRKVVFTSVSKESK